MCGRTPNSTALADALTLLAGEAYAAAPEPVYLRVAEHAKNIVIDLGDLAGRAIVVSASEWRVVDRSPVVFRRTAATGALPVPERGGDLAELRTMLNVTADTWPLVVGWLAAGLVPNMPHPILLLGGQQGTGKSTAAEQLVGLIDPSPAVLRSPPRDSETWAIGAAASWVVAVDNVSTIPDWWSDSLCKAVTGDGWLRRKLYTDGELAVLSFRRVVLLTSIDPGALRGDLGDRVLLVDLEPINEAARLTQRGIESRYQAARPRLFGALLDLLCCIWGVLPSVELTKMPRMATSLNYSRRWTAFARTAVHSTFTWANASALPRQLSKATPWRWPFAGFSTWNPAGKGRPASCSAHHARETATRLARHAARDRRPAQAAHSRARANRRLRHLSAANGPQRDAPYPAYQESRQ